MLTTKNKVKLVENLLESYDIKLDNFMRDSVKREIIKLNDEEFQKELNLLKEDLEIKKLMKFIYNI